MTTPTTPPLTWGDLTPTQQNVLTAVFVLDEVEPGNIADVGEEYKQEAANDLESFGLLREVQTGYLITKKGKDMAIARRAELTSPVTPKQQEPLTWGGLTLPQRERLLGISRGQHAQRGDETWMSLLNNKLIEVVYTYPADVAIDALTPLGGDLLRQRDTIMVAALTAYANGEYLGKGKAQTALAQVQEGGEHE